MYCSKCGIQISDDANFCKRCGTRQEVDFRQQFDPIKVVSEEVLEKNNAYQDVAEVEQENLINNAAALTNLEVINEIDSKIQQLINSFDTNQVQEKLVQVVKSKQEDIESNVSSTNVFQKMDMSYLEMLMILEFIKNETSKKILHIEEMLVGLGEKSKIKKPTRYMAKHSKNYKLIFGFLVLVTILMICPIYFLVQEKTLHRYLTGNIVIVVILVVSSIMVYCKEKKKLRLQQKRFDLQYKKERQKVKKFILEDKLRVSLELEQCKELEERRERLQLILANTYNLLQELYEIKKIPIGRRNQEFLCTVYLKYKDSTMTLSQVIKNVIFDPENISAEELEVQRKEIESKLLNIQQDIDKTKVQYEELFSSAQKQFLERDDSIETMLIYSQIQTGIMEALEICQSII